MLSRTLSDCILCDGDQTRLDQIRYNTNVTIRNVSEAKAELSNLLLLAEQGEEVVIARAGKPVVKLVLIERCKGPRKLGLMKDKMWIAPDFDEWNEAIEKMFYGDSDD